MTRRPVSYVTETTITVATCSHVVTATVKRDRVAVTVPAIENRDHEFVEAIAVAILGAVRRARRIYRRTYGRRAP